MLLRLHVHFGAWRFIPPLPTAFHSDRTGLACVGRGLRSVPLLAGVGVRGGTGPKPADVLSSETTLVPALPVQVRISTSLLREASSYGERLLCTCSAALRPAQDASRRQVSASPTNDIMRRCLLRRIHSLGRRLTLHWLAYLTANLPLLSPSELAYNPPAGDDGSPAAALPLDMHVAVRRRPNRPAACRLAGPGCIAPATCASKSQ